MKKTSIKSSNLSIKKKGKQTNTIPKGSKIVDEDVNISTEQIENGFLVTKRREIKYKRPGSEYSDWTTVETKYFSKEDPLTIQVNDASLADAFKDGE